MMELFVFFTQNQNPIEIFDENGNDAWLLDETVKLWEIE